MLPCWGAGAERQRAPTRSRLAAGFCVRTLPSECFRVLETFVNCLFFFFFWVFKKIFKNNFKVEFPIPRYFWHLAQPLPQIYSGDTPVSLTSLFISQVCETLITVIWSRRSSTTAAFVLVLQADIKLDATVKTKPTLTVPSPAGLSGLKSPIISQSFLSGNLQVPLPARFVFLECPKPDKWFTEEHKGRALC